MDRQSQIRAAKRGEVRARNAMGVWLGAELLTFFSGYFGRERVDELIQETMKDIMAKLVHAPDDPDAFRAWALSFGGTKARASSGELRREHARRAKLIVGDHPSPQSLDAGLLHGERQQLIVDHLPRLPKIYRDAIQHQLDGGDNRSFAIQAGIPEGTARRRLWKAKTTLRRLIQGARVTRTSLRTPPTPV